VGEPGDEDRVQDRVTILPLSDHRALQQFEESRDAGKTWKVVFKAEHRPRTDASGIAARNLSFADERVTALRG
jgi:hypothetical protein